MSKGILAINREKITVLLPPRPGDSHKGLFGTVAMIGGASGMVGAALLAARAALKMGAGSVHVGLMAENSPTVDPVQPELMLHGAADVLQRIKPNVITLGCGMGTSTRAYKLLYQALQSTVTLVLDADALNLIARDPELQNDVRRRLAATVLTPHPGEAARLLGCTTEEVQLDRVNAVKQLGRKFECSVVLKGASSLCVTRDGKIYINTTGNPGMSTAGSGDVLTGMIAAFIAQGMAADAALLLAVHLHGAAADALAKQGVTIGMTATEITDWARWLLNQWKIES